MSVSGFQPQGLGSCAKRGRGRPYRVYRVSPQVVSDRKVRGSSRSSSRGTRRGMEALAGVGFSPGNARIEAPPGPYLDGALIAGAAKRSGFPPDRFRVSLPTVRILLILSGEVEHYLTGFYCAIGGETVVERISAVSHRPMIGRSLEYLDAVAAERVRPPRGAAAVAVVQ
jgi:hypothetical protein